MLKCNIIGESKFIFYNIYQNNLRKSFIVTTIVMLFVVKIKNSIKYL